jgi:hypothetical protein
MENNARPRGPDEWGPHGWKFLHYVTLGYPDNPTKEQKEKYKFFFELLKFTLPCSFCRLHYEQNYNKLPLNDDILNNKEKFIKWLIDLHNIVNKMKNKPIVKYEDARRMIVDDVICYDQNKQIVLTANKPITNTNLSTIFILITLLILIMLAYAIIRNKKIFNKTI